MNIPRYIDTFEEEKNIDLDATTERLEQLEKDMKEVDEKIKKYCDELGIKAPIF